MKKKEETSSSGALEIHVLNGPNLNMLGFREPEVYGSDTLADLEQKIKDAAKASGAKVKLKFFQTNHEGEMIEYIHSIAIGAAQSGGAIGVIMNPAAWSHTSIAIRDAVLMLKPMLIVEVHITNLTEREEFRHHSFIEDLADYRIMGMGQEGYVDALRWLISEMQRERLDVH